MELILGIASLFIGIIIALIPYYRSKYILRPEVTIEIIPTGGFSAPRGYSSKNELDENGNIDGNNGIQIFELTWKYKVKITNNSELTAFYPKIEFNPNGPKFTKFDKINQLEPIKSTESLELKAEYDKYEEKVGRDRTQPGVLPPPEFKSLEIALSYENSKKRRFYTVYDFNAKDNKNQFTRKKPNHYGNN